MDSLSLKNLTNALSEVDNWQQLGVQLDINYHKLMEFRSHPTIEECKLAMLQFWLDTDVEASWEKLQCGLKNMGLNRVVKQIQEKYQVPLNQPTCPPETMTIIPPPLTPSTPDPLSNQNEGVSTQVPAQVEHVSTVHTHSASPTDQLVEASEKEVSVVQQEKDMLVSMYDKLVVKAAETFSESQDTSPSFFLKLRTSVAVLPTSLKYQHHYFLEIHSSQIAKATTVVEIFSILNRYCNFLNCSLLAHIIDKFGDEDLKEELSTYTTALKVFRLRTKITDFSKTCAGNSELPPGFVALKMRMGDKWEHCTLEDIEEYRKSLAQNSSVADYALYFAGGVPGSIYLLWSVPDHAVPFLTMDQQFCNQYGVENVTINAVGLEEYKKLHLYDVSAFKPLQHIDEFSEGLVWASGEGCLEDVVFFLSTGVEVNSRGQEGDTALILASRGGHLDVVRELLKAQADVNLQDEDGWTALMWASARGHSDTIRELLSAGAQVDLQNKYGMTALMWASSWGHTDIARFLLSAGAQVDLQDEDGMTALIWASFRGHTDIARVLLSAGAQVDLQDKYGMTALMWASDSGHTDIACVLLSAGAQVDLQDEFGQTALIRAVQDGRTETVNVLVEAGADVNLQEKFGLTALIRAVQKGRTESVNILVEAGADVNLQEKTSGRSAIFYGAERGDLEIVQLLIQRGANLSLKDKDGVTADEVAEVHGHQAICDELKKHVRVDRRPLSKAVRDRVMATGHLLRALYKRLEEKIFRTQKKELARRTQDLDQEIPLPSRHGRKGVRDPQEHIVTLQKYTDMPRSAC